MLLATDLAEALVREGVPFRDAHEAVGTVVAHCLEKDLDLRTLSLEDLRAVHADCAAPASELLSLERALEARSLVGGTARGTVSGALDVAEAEVGDALARLAAEDTAS
jgi:argininosuccinate lyase